MIQSLFPSYPINHCIRATNVHHRPPLTHTWEINTWSRNQLPHPGNVEARPRRRAISVWFLIKETTTVSPGPNHIPIPKLIHCACPVLSPTNLFQAATDPSCLRSWLSAMARAGVEASKLCYHSFFRFCAASYFELVANHLGHHIPRPWGILMLSHRHCRGGRRKYIL